MTDTTSRKRQPRGTATGGQFATEAKGESSVALQPPSKYDATFAQVIQDGSLGVEHEGAMSYLTLDRYELGSDIVDSLDIAQYEDDENAFVHANLSLDGAYDTLADSLGLKGDDEDKREWINERSETITRFIEQRYDAELEVVDDDLSSAKLRFFREVSPDTPISTIAQESEGGELIRAYNEMDHGSFGHDNLWDAVAQHVRDNEPREQ